jgi:hypothetical protein
VAERTRLVATDLDGTLLRSDGTVSTRTVAAIREARASGVEVLAVTARSPWSTSPVAAGCGMGPLAVCGNGAVVWDVAEARLVEHTPLAAQEAAGPHSPVSVDPHPGRGQPARGPRAVRDESLAAPTPHLGVR